MKNPQSGLALKAHQGTVLILVIVPLLATAFAFVRLWGNMLSLKDVILFACFFLATAQGVTIGYHRMLTHNSFKTNPVLKALLLIFGIWSLQGSPISWAAIHQKHHVYSDKDGDPHSPIGGFLHAHVGWLLRGEKPDTKTYARDQMEDPVIRFINKTTPLWAILGMVLPLLLGGWSGFLWAGLVRVFLVHHITWSVNSICHTFGTRDFDLGKDRSMNNWVVGLLALGEGWHNNHHAFPRSAFHGLNWKQVDLSGQVIRLMGVVGLAHHIYKVPNRVILARRAGPRRA